MIRTRRGMTEVLSREGGVMRGTRRGHELRSSRATVAEQDVERSWPRRETPSESDPAVGRDPPERPTEV
jgi:hypothetical protein